MSKKTKEIKSMNAEQRKTRIAELKLELIRATVPGQKSGMKTKEIKKALARLFTFNRAESAKRLKSP